MPQKTFHVNGKIILDISVSVEAKDLEEATKKADDLLFWAYQAGAPEQHNAVSINDCELEIDGETIDILEYREPPEEQE